MCSHPAPALIERAETLHPDLERVALLGWHCYPTSSTSRAAAFAGAADAASCDLDQLAAWARDYPGCNWRVHCGLSRIWALDVDVPGAGHAHDGRAALTELIRLHHPLPPRPMTRSGGGGWLLVFDHSGGEALIGQSGKPAPGLDPLRGAQPITIPPSRHIRTGAPYRWITPPWEVSPPRAPAWLIALLTPPPPPPPPEWVTRGVRPDNDRAARKLEASLARVRAAEPGTRNNTLNREAYGLARWVGAGLLDTAEVASRLYHAGVAAGMVGRRVENIIRGAMRKGVTDPIRFDGTGVRT